MRILLIIKNFDFGGAENHVRELANSLAHSGNNIFLISEKGRQQKLLNKGIRFYALKMLYAFIPINLIYLILFVKKHNIEVIHAHQRLPILMASFAGLITGLPVVATVHGRTRFDLKSRISRKVPYRILFVSQQVLEVSAKKNEIEKRSVVIPNWISYPPDQFAKIYRSITYISRLDKKHASLLLFLMGKILPRLLPDYPGITLHIVGEGDYFGEIKKEAQIRNLQFGREAIVLHGFFPEVAGMILKSELVIGVGRVAIEALACGIPVLPMNNQRMGTFVSRRNYLDYRLNNFVAVKMGPPAEDSLYKALSDFFSDTEPYRKEALLLKEIIAEDLNREKITGEIEKIYRECQPGIP